MLFETEKNIVIWGTGNTARKLYYKLRHIHNVRGWTENLMVKGIVKTIYNKPVLSLEEISKKDLIIIASEKYWEEIVLQIDSMGYEFFKDYFPYWIIENTYIDWMKLVKIKDMGIKFDLVQIVRKMTRGKKLAIINGNCNTTSIQRYLESNKEFNRNFIFIQIPRVCEARSGVNLAAIAMPELWQLCDLFISQKILLNNEFAKEFATEYIVSQLREDCQKIIIANMFFVGYWPQCKQPNAKPLKEISFRGLFPYGDKNVDQMMEHGEYTPDEIISKISDENFYCLDDILETGEKSLNELKRREEDCTVKMYDYIEEHWKERQLFYAPGHPNNELLKECAKRILTVLKIQEKFFKHERYLDTHYSLRSQDLVIYPSVIKALNLEDYLDSFFANKLIDMEIRSFDEYMRTFIDYCYD
ncbi:WcbI family polysaccharide biosynthesis putative acetyltransferase [Clostridium chromiireducens]|uniref:Polysaccharide biosynthesis enzyme WcbI domain-containing protein n=1 Tax=Clostridium chromiireducens TaxID=225345 RepID=A0A1V4IX95_9CLOT|nr:WcbI family polysaccharide biosynthesis putative acetyltransferase [Clostridium chromiireducens]OPJ64513.1 hypothetical protein CLCHR_11600 [Clostridium chromiireducens]